MDTEKQERLKAAGWKVGTSAEFLGLSAEEEALVEFKLEVAKQIREQRSSAGLSQAQLAKRIGSSQSRIAKAEAGDPSVSTDLLLRALFGTGGRVQDIARRGRSRARRPTRDTVEAK